MRLRTQIVLVLLLLGLLPLAGLATFTVPTILGKLQSVIYHLHLQSLRASFADLDEYMAGRREMLRFLSKLPPPALFREEDGVADLAADIEQQRFIYWINQLLKTPQDIYRLIYLDALGNEQLRLERTDLGAPLAVQTASATTAADMALFEQAFTLLQDNVLIGPVGLGNSFMPGAPDHLIIRFAAPIYLDNAEIPAGVVLAFMDIGGLPQAFANILWAYEDGRYLLPPTGSAFADYPGLETIFTQGKLALWQEDTGRAVFWLPLLATETAAGRVWVGRPVNVSDVDALRQTLWLHALSALLVLGLVIAVLLRWAMFRVGQFTQHLTEGLRGMLAGETGVQFNLGRALELRNWASDLTRLAQTHEQAAHTLRQRAQELEESNRYKSEFLANISHELRTPLQAILALSNLLADNEEERLAPEQVKQARIIHRAGRDLLQMIDDILDLSKIEARKMPLAPSSVELASFSAELLELFTPLAHRKHIRLSQQTNPTLPTTLVTDADKLRQILRNFLANAIKFTPERGEVCLQMQMNPYPDAGERPYAFMVQDSGIGVAPARQQAIFEAFRQADGSTRRKYGGTGLGLTISTKLAALLGGRIALESTEGAGARFYLLLPATLDVTHYPNELLDFSQLAPSTPETDPTPTTNMPLPKWANVKPTAQGQLLLLDTDPQRSLALIQRCQARHWEAWVADAHELESLLNERSFAVVICHAAAFASHLPYLRQRLPQARYLSYRLAAETAPAADTLWPISDDILEALLTV